MNIATMVVSSHESAVELAKQKIDLLNYIEHATGVKAKRRSKSYVFDPCPFCGRKNHFFVVPEKNFYHTFSGCGKSGTIIDFLMEYEKLTLQEAIKKILDLAGTELSPGVHAKRSRQTHQENGETKNQIPQFDFTELIEQLHANVVQTTYFKERGLTDQTIKKYKLGFAENGLNAVQQKFPLFQNHRNFLQMYKYFLPVWNEEGKCHYFIPRIDESSVPPYFESKPSKTFNLPQIPVQLFNDRYLKSADTKLLFVTEGIFDALSIEEFGYSCIALNGATNVNKLIALLEEQIDICIHKTFVLVPDNDMAGQNMMQKIQEGFRKIGLSIEICKLPETYKDVNEYLQKDRVGLEKLLTETVKGIQEREFSSDEYVASYLDVYCEEIMNAPTVPISTGFPDLDASLSGGIIPGLYVLGAVSSLGKTSFILQVADYIASQGIPVMFITLEMSKKELVSRSLSRQSFVRDHRQAYSAIDFLKGDVPEEIVLSTIESYRNTAKNMRIEDSSRCLHVSAIREQVETFKQRFEKFVVFIDYLQILQSPNNRSDKQTVDFNVTQLKLISRDFDVPVIAVSSFNRTNYHHTAGFESFKESGGIEYSADVIMALQLKGMDKLATISDETKRRENMNQLKAQPIRPIELVILKQRNGISYAKSDFSYYAKFNYFQQVNAG